MSPLWPFPRYSVPSVSVVLVLWPLTSDLWAAAGVGGGAARPDRERIETLQGGKKQTDTRSFSYFQTSRVQLVMKRCSEQTKRDIQRAGPGPGPTERRSLFTALNDVSESSGVSQVVLEFVQRCEDQYRLTQSQIQTIVTQQGLWTDWSTNLVQWSQTGTNWIHVTQTDQDQPEQRCSILKPAPFKPPDWWWCCFYHAALELLTMGLNGLDLFLRWKLPE